MTLLHNLPEAPLCPRHGVKLAATYTSGRFTGWVCPEPHLPGAPALTMAPTLVARGPSFDASLVNVDGTIEEVPGAG